MDFKGYEEYEGCKDCISSETLIPTILFCHEYEQIVYGKWCCEEFINKQEEPNYWTCNNSVNVQRG